MSSTFTSVAAPRRRGVFRVTRMTANKRTIPRNDILDMNRASVLPVTREDCTYNSALFAMTCNPSAKKLVLLVAAIFLFWDQTLAKSSPAAKVPPNVVLVTIDTVRADHVGCYGTHDLQTP